MTYSGDEIKAREKLSVLGIPIVPGNEYIINNEYTILCRFNCESKPSNAKISIIKEEIDVCKSYEITDFNTATYDKFKESHAELFDGFNMDDTIYLDSDKFKNAIKLFDDMKNNNKSMRFNLFENTFSIKDESVSVSFNTKNRIESSVIIGKKYISQILKIIDKSSVIGFNVPESDAPIIIRAQINGFKADLMIAPRLEHN